MFRDGGVSVRSLWFRRSSERRAASSNQRGFHLQHSPLTSLPIFNRASNVVPVNFESSTSPFPPSKALTMTGILLLMELQAASG